MERATVAIVFAVVVGSALLSACRPDECRKMQDCCDAVKDAEWVGDSCGELAQGVRDPNTCRTITRSIRQSLESRSEPIPQVCQ